LLKCTVGAISSEDILEKVGWALSKILYTPLTTSTWRNGPGDALVSEDGFFLEDSAADAGDGIAGRGGACTSKTRRICRATRSDVAAARPYNRSPANRPTGADRDAVWDTESGGSREACRVHMHPRIGAPFR